jgi:uncharacterized membrane protein YqiK
MIIVYIILAIVSIIALVLLYRFAKPDGTMVVDTTDPENVRIDLTGVPVLDKDQDFFVLRVNRIKTKH